MSYLLAKYALLFLLTGVLSFVLGYWFSRRNFVDVTKNFEKMQSDNSQWDRLFQRLDGLPEPKDTDLSDVYARLDAVSTAVGSIPQPETVSFASIEHRLDTLNQGIREIPLPIPAEKIDLGPMDQRLSKIESAIREIPAPPRAEAIDLTPVDKKLGEIESAVRQIPVPEKPQRLDLTPVDEKLRSIDAAIRKIPEPQKPREVDLSPISARIDSLEHSLGRIRQPKEVDLSPIGNRLTAIETEMAGIGKRLAQKTPTPARERRAPSTAIRKTTSEPRILSAALYGKKDDLKLISGVGPKLERLLNKNGVYYFWQVAEWNRGDINIIDERLDSFKGRIARDNWVRQAKQLQRQPTAARMPAE